MPTQFPKVKLLGDNNLRLKLILCILGAPGILQENQKKTIFIHFGNIPIKEKQNLFGQTLQKMAANHQRSRKVQKWGGNCNCNFGQKKMQKKIPQKAEMRGVLLSRG